MNSTAQAMIDELADLATIHRGLQRKAEAAGDHGLATTHGVMAGSYEDAIVRVLRQLPFVLEAERRSVIDWAPGELVEAFGR